MKEQRIKLDENYYLTGDKYNWILHFEKEGGISEKTGKPIISKDEWYFPSIHLSLKEYANQRGKSAKNYKELVILLKEIKETISKVNQ